MKQLFLLCIIFFIVIVGCQTEVSNDIELPITLEPVIECDALSPCPVGECYIFPNDSNAICYEGNPCDECDSKECIIAESYPMQVFCE
jgi:hypothetical protein